MSSISIPTSSATGTSPPSSSETSTPSVASRTPNLGAIIGGSVGGVVVLLWILVLLWYAHRHSCFRRPGYTRQRDERREGGLFGFGKRSGSPAITPTTESAIAAPRPVTGFGARTFGEIRPSVYGGEAPRQSAYDPVTPRTTFNQPPPPPPKSNPRPRSSFGDRPRSGFGAERERPRSAFGSRSPSRRGFFGSGVRDTEWAGAPRRINVEPNASDEEGRTGVLGWFARVREHAAQRKRVQAEYEEDMKRMRGRAAVENDYSRY